MKQTGGKTWHKAVCAAMAVLVVFGTANASMLPAAAMESSQSSAQAEEDLATGADGTVQGTTHAGTVINLFDYWTTGQDDVDFTDDDSEVKSQWNMGINQSHALKFLTKIPWGQTTGTANAWTKSVAPCAGIVADTLGKDGYPYLSKDTDKVEGSDESLAYLFDPKKEVDGKESFRNVTGLLQVGADGYYYYDSSKNFAEYNKASNTFTLYDSWGVKSHDNKGDGQFFPFNKYEEVKDEASNSTRLNHYFGINMTTRFVQRNDGYMTPNQKHATTFDFSGDDDVWIFIDGVLVCDLGGIHDRSSVDINFASGQVTVNEGTGYEQKTSIYEIFEAAGKAGDESDWKVNEEGNKIFANNTYHTLKFFYLERGNYASNLRLKYNLSSYPPTGINKINQYGEAVAGAGFSVYKADENYNIISDTPVYTGTTDENGEMIFVDEDEMPYTQGELKEKFGEHFVLRETTIPEGYRRVEENINMHFENNVLLCDNTKYSGVYASTSIKTSAPNTIMLRKEYQGSKSVTVLDENQQGKGKIFAVVLHYNGERNADGTVKPAVGADGTESVANALAREENWVPVYGSGKEGFMHADLDAYKGSKSPAIAAAIDTAKKYKDGKNVFSLTEGGALEGGIEGLPGRATEYYHMLSQDQKEKTRFTVAYYWTAADSLEGATDENTYLIDADGVGEGSVSYRFDRAFGSTINVPNLRNRLLMQKKDIEGNWVNGAVFAMYDVAEEDGKIYYKADDGTLIYLEKDEDGDNAGRASLKDGTQGTYTVDISPEETSAKGKITVNTGAKTYTISPEVNAKDEPLVRMTVKSDENILGEDGTVAFQFIKTGQYYVREISVPRGYKLNTNEVMTLVTSNSTYVNAGTAGDGIVVGRGPGYLASSLQELASIGFVDNTLSWVFSQLKISDVSTSFKDVNSEAYYDSSKWSFTNKQNAKDWSKDTVASGSGKDPLTAYLEYNPSSTGTVFNFKIMPADEVNEVAGAAEKISENFSDSRRLTTDIGWSYLEMYQNYPYGKEKNKQQATYENWLYADGSESGDMDDISALFSRSIYVQVTDEPSGCNLEISKTVQGAADDNTDVFEFTVNLKDKDGNALTEAYPYYVYDISELMARSEVTAAGKEQRTIKDGEVIQLKNNQLAVIMDLPAETSYTVTEKRQAGYSTTAVRDKDKKTEETYSFSLTGGEPLAVSGKTLGSGTEDDPFDTSTVDFTNLLGLNIIKVDGLNNDIKLPGAVFTLTREITVDEKVVKQCYTPEGWTDTDSQEAKLKTEGAEGRITLNIPDGSYELTEISAPEGYMKMSSPVQITVEGGKITQAISGTSNYTLINEGTAVLIPNSAGKLFPETGGPGTLIYTLGGLLLMAAALIYGYKKHSIRKKIESEK